jgi:hypothetical protein
MSGKQLRGRQILLITIHGDLRALYPRHISAAKSNIGLLPIACANDHPVGPQSMRCHD